jgi:hypothetical protein
MKRVIRNSLKFTIPLVVILVLLAPTITVSAAAIDVGFIPLDNQASSLSHHNTVLLKNNPSNDTGTINTIKIWAATNIDGLIVGTFYNTAGDDYKCRDSESIGAVTAGSEQSFSVTLNITTGDLIGFYFTSGTIERKGSGTSGEWFYSGEAIDVNDVVTYTSVAGTSSMINGTGTTVAIVVPTVTTSAASNIDYTAARMNGEITNTGGENATIQGFEYDTDSGAPYASDQHSHGDFGAGTFLEDLTGLTEGITYFGRAYATNSAGTGYGSEISFTTLDTSPTVTTESAISIAMDLNGVTSGNFSADLTSLGDDTGAEGSFQYGMSTSYELGETVAVAYNSTGVFGDAIPNDLLPGNTYYYRAKAVNVNGTSYGATGNFTLTMPTFTTDNAIYTSPGAASATLAGNVTNMGVASNATVYFQWGTNTTYGTDTADQVASVISDITQAISGFLRNVTIHFRTVTEVGSNTTYGVDETFLIASPAPTESLWYQPIDVITQSGTDWIVPDRAGTENGVITWGTNPTGVTAEQGPFGGGVGGGTEAKAPPYAIGDPGDFIETDPPITGNFTTDISPDFPGSDIWDDLADSSSTPVQLIWMLITGFVILVISLTSSWMMKRFGNASHFIKGAIIFGLMGLCVGLNLYDWWMIMIFAVIALALSWMSQQRGATN